MALTTCSVCHRSWRATSADEACPWCGLKALREGIARLVMKDAEVDAARERLEQLKDVPVMVDMYLVLDLIRHGLAQQNMLLTRMKSLPYGSVLAAMRPLSLYLRSLGLDVGVPGKVPLEPSDAAVHKAACPTCGRINCPSCETTGCPD